MTKIIVHGDMKTVVGVNLGRLWQHVHTPSRDSREDAEDALSQILIAVGATEEEVVMTLALLQSNIVIGFEG